MATPAQQADDGGPDIIRAKWIMDGAATLEEAASRVRVFAASLDELAAQGYELEGEVTDDYGYLRRPGG